MEEVTRYFKDHFGEKVGFGASLDKLYFEGLSEEKAGSLPIRF